MDNNNNFWINFWKEHSKLAINKDNQSQVLRTNNKKPLDKTSWKKIVDFSFSFLDFKKNDNVLDLFGGNGLFAQEIAQLCRDVTVVDVSKELLNKINKKKYKNIKTVTKDIRKINFYKKEYSKILIYAGIQYLTEKEVIDLFYKLFNCLQEGGMIYIGDIPEREKIWNFYNNKKRENDYFKSIINNSPIIGTWFDYTWLEKMVKFIGFSESKKIKQKNEMVYSHFRFDMLIKK
jgi:cyclopropane fatty-acyl-phospholipid synthase-like methyltransferase